MVVTISTPLNYSFPYVCCKGTAMKMNNSFTIESNSLLPAECQALTTCLGKLLHALGSLLQEESSQGAGLSPETGKSLINIGRKLVRAAEYTA